MITANGTMVKLPTAPVWKQKGELLIMAFSAILHNPRIIAFYEKWIDKGKEVKVTLTACMRKSLGVMNAIIRNNRAWENRPNVST